MFTMKKKIAVPLITFAIILAAGFCMYLASNQAAQPSAPSAELSAPTLSVHEIGKTFTRPSQLGNVHYTAKSATNLLFFSSRYESLKTCSSQPIAGLQLTNQKISEEDIPLEGQSTWGHLTLHPQGECTDPSAKTLYDATERMFRQ